MRNEALDGLRGAAVLLMVADHCLGVALAYGASDHLQLVRLTLTRAALPLFMCVAGWLWCERGLPKFRRLAQIAAVAVVSSALAWVCGMPLPEVLGVYVLVAFVFGRLVVQWPILAASVGLLQAWNLPVPWAGYQPGYVVVWLALGVLAAESRQLPAWQWPRWLRAVGRRPLMWYLGHLAVLAACVVTESSTKSGGWVERGLGQRPKEGISHHCQGVALSAVFVSA